MRDQGRLLAAARGEVAADLVITGGRVVNVYTGEIEAGDVAIVDGVIVGVGEGYNGVEVHDVGGAYLVPGFIDGHVHIESSLCVPGEFARAVVGRGVTAVVTDPHEIANVAGRAGVEFMYEASRSRGGGLGLDVTVMAPSCVPATHMAAGGAVLTAEEIGELRAAGVVHGLAEVMNFPGVIFGDVGMRGKMDVMAGRPMDGHCPGVRGKGLNAYVLSGVGSDHESVSVEEAREKLARGMYLLIREATNARNLEALLPVVTRENARRICFCTDDRTPGDLIREGSVDMMVARAIAWGVPVMDAIRMATLNTAEWFGLSHLGGIAPGKVANINVMSSLSPLVLTGVYARGVRVGDNHRDAEAQRGKSGGALGRCVVEWGRVSFSVAARGARIRVIVTQADQLVTGMAVVTARVVDGCVEADVLGDVLKMAVVERHGGSGKCGVGFIKGFGLKGGAIAGTVAHDHHNLVVIGCSDLAMYAAGKAVTEMGGGLAVVDSTGVVTARLGLPVGGLMSELPVEEVAAGYDAVVGAARGLGSGLGDPFMAMSFMALEVIPSLKLTEQGLVDVEKFGFVDLFVEEDG